MIFIRNAVFGMAGGRLALTTMLDQVKTPTPKGRRAEAHGCHNTLATNTAALKKGADLVICLH